jgi:hypothetical protein
LIYHDPGWLGALEHEYGKKILALAYEDAEGRFQGVLPLLGTRGLPLKLSGHPSGQRLSSLPRTPLAGPLAASIPATTALVRAAMEHAQSVPGTQLELKTTMPGLDILVPELQCLRWRTSYVVPLAPVSRHAVNGIPEGQAGVQLRFGKAGNHLKIKCSVNRAVKHGLRARPAETLNDLRAWYDLYVETMRANVIPARPLRFFECLWRDLWPVGAMQLWVAELGNRIVAGIMILRFGATAIYAFAGGKRKDFSLSPNDLLHWNALHEAWRNGYQGYDFGEVSEDNPRLAHYKRKWGSEPVPLYRYYYPATSLPGNGGPRGAGKSFGGAVWRHLPLPVTAILSDWIYEYL